MNLATQIATRAGIPSNACLLFTVKDVADGIVSMEDRTGANDAAVALVGRLLATDILDLVDGSTTTATLLTPVKRVTRRESSERRTCVVLRLSEKGAPTRYLAITSEPGGWTC